MTAKANTAQFAIIENGNSEIGAPISMGFYIKQSLLDPGLSTLDGHISYYGESRKRSGSGPWFAAHRNGYAPDVFSSSDGMHVQLCGTASLQWIVARRTYWRYYLYSTGTALYSIQAYYRSYTGYVFGVKRFDSILCISPSFYKTKQVLYSTVYYESMWDWTDRQIIDMAITRTRELDQTISFGSINTLNLAYSWPEVNAKLAFDYRFNEWTNFQMAREFGWDFWPNRYASGIAMAYVNAIEDLPATTSNNIENAFQVIEAIISLCTTIMAGNVGSALKSGAKSYKDLRNVWLAWRYSYCTTKSDIEELSSLTSRLESLCSDDLSEARGTYRDDEFLFRVSLGFNTDTVLPKGFRDGLTTFGLKLNAAKAWDLIPFSFMVDWFAHVGSMLQWCSEYYDSSLTYHFRSMWGSFQTSYDNQLVYARFRLPRIPPNFVMPQVAPKHTKTRTLMFRLTDMLTIFSQ